MKPQLLCLLCLLSVSLAVAADLPPVDIIVEPSSSGWVVGHVYDADTHEVVSGATVAACQKGAFADKGDAVGVTDATGKYQLRTPAGRVSSRTRLSGFLFGGNTSKKTLRLDINECLLRISAPGYKTFEGFVPADRTSAEEMKLTMEPVLLPKADSARVSFVADDWGPIRILEMSLNPPIIRAGKPSELKVVLGGPQLPEKSEIKGFLFSDLWKAQSVKAARGADGKWCLTKKITVSKKQSSGWSEIFFGAYEQPCEILYGTYYERPLAQVTASDADDAAAKLRAQAYDLRRQGKSEEAYALWLEVAAHPSATPRDVSILMKLAGLLGREKEAAQSVEKWAKAADKKTKLSRSATYANALLTSGQPQQALDSCFAAMQDIPEKQRASKLPPEFQIALGMAYLEQGKLKEATEIHDRLAGKKAVEGLTDFSQRVRLVTAEELTKTNPSATAWADYSGILLDEGRWDAGVRSLREALVQYPDSAELRWSLRYALLHTQGQQQAAEMNLDQALAEAATQLQPAKEGARKTKDFTAWHTYGLLLYRKAAQQQAAGSAAEAQDTLAKCVATLLEGLHCARAGGAVTQKIGLFTSQGIRAINGWAYPEAQCDLNIILALRQLAVAPDDFHARLSLGRELVKLGQTDLAEQALLPLQKVRPAEPQLLYELAQIAGARNDGDNYEKLLLEVIATVPNHPAANLDLARYYADLGEMASSAPCAARHAAFYGTAEATSAGE